MSKFDIGDRFAPDALDIDTSDELLLGGGLPSFDRGKQQKSLSGAGPLETISENDLTDLLHIAADFSLKVPNDNSMDPMILQTIRNEFPLSPGTPNNLVQKAATMLCKHPSLDETDPVLHQALENATDGRELENVIGVLVSRIKSHEL